MIDYCIMTATEADFETAMLSCGVVDGDGNPTSPYICVDRIGPITMPDGTVYPEFYANIRFLEEPTEDQVATLSVISVDPSQPHYRVWA